MPNIANTLRHLPEKAALQACVERISDSQKTGAEIILTVGGLGRADQVSAAAGHYAGQPIDAQTPFCLASATKLFATALIFRLVDQKRVTLDDRLVSFFPADALAGLHQIDGRADLTGDITIGHLLAHTSGLGDYFEQRRRDGSVFSEQLLAGRDSVWTVADVIEVVRRDLKPRFRPGAPGKAFYSDTNFQLLGHIIEQVTGAALAEVVQEEISQVLQLSNTHLFCPNKENAACIPLRNGDHFLTVPGGLQSTRLDGGGVSTSADMLRFLQGFYGGELFDIDAVMALQEWRKIFFPLRNGTGMMMFRTPWIFSPFRRQPDLIGHSGISGAFAYFAPATGLMMTGTVNQLAARSLPYKLMLGVLGTL